MATMVTTTDSTMYGQAATVATTMGLGIAMSMSIALEGALMEGALLESLLQEALFQEGL